MNKKENKEWMERAESVLQDPKWVCPLFKDKGETTQDKGETTQDKGRTTIYDSYNGQVAALGVSILMIGLKPTLAIYYQDAPKKEKGKAYRRALLEVIVRMLWLKENKDVYKSAESLVRYILDVAKNPSDGEKKISKQEEKKLTTDILNCSIALKQVIRTYKLEKDGEDNK